MQGRLVPRTSAWAAMGVAALGGLTLARVEAQPPGQAEVLRPKAGEPLVLDAGRSKVRVVLVAEGLAGPWHIEFLPGGDTILVTESPGRLRIIENGVLSPDVVWTPPSPDGRDVLHSVVAHPDFEQNRLLYLSYLKGDDEQQTLAVGRGRLEGHKLTDVEEIFVADAWENARMAWTGRMMFGRDGMLFVTVGDRDPLCCQPVDDNSVRIRAQNLGDHVGKILRITDEGGAPSDNPFVGQEGAEPEIYTYGHRNSYGLDYHPETGELWQLEIGPMGGDEINILEPGGNYGWPLVSTGRNYSGTLVSEQPWYREGMINPRMFWVPQISPSSMLFYTGDAFPEWRGSLFVPALSGQQVQRVVLGQSGQAERREPLLTEMGLRFRDVAQGPDGFVYLATELRYGSDTGGTIIRLEPAE